MNEQEKELLLKELCSRQPYKLHCRVFKLNEDIKENDDILYGVIGDNVITLKSDKDECLMYYQIKPYLRPMESMTKEEIEDYHNLCTKQWNVHIDDYWYYDTVESIDWLNSNHFDHRGLIQIGIAIPAKEGMYK